MDKNRRYALLLILATLIAVDVSLVRLDVTHSRRVLTFAMLDVGQGDALFIESPSGAQMLFDAGPPRKILNSLSHVLSPFDRTIDAIVITNPDADHIGGFLDILKDYKVGLILEPGTTNGSKTFQNLRAEIASKNIPDILARKGMKIHMGEVVIDVLFPDRDVSAWSTNDGSIVARLAYGSTSIMLTGDSTSKTEKIILDGQENLRSAILKVGHHGSRSSTSSDFVNRVGPEYALISSGAGNSYGHPHEEVLETLRKAGAKILRTDALGTIVMKSDGATETFSFHR